MNVIFKNNFLNLSKYNYYYRSIEDNLCCEEFDTDLLYGLFLVKDIQVTPQLPGQR